MRTLLCFAVTFVALVTTAQAQDVSVTQDEASFTLSNGVITAQVSKRTGDMTSMTFRGREMLNDKSGHPGAYWSHDTTGGRAIVAGLTIDPRTNGGERGEVSVKGISGGIKMGHGPGAAPDGDFPADIEIRYTLHRGDTGIYTYCTFDHRPEYAAATMTEARFAAKLADTFVIGRSEAGKDWYFQHVPHNENPAATSQPFRRVTTTGRATPYTIAFDLASAPRGRAMLRVAICGTGAREVEVSVNGQRAGRIERMLVDGAIARHSIQGLWYEREVAFDAALLKVGTSVVTLTVPAGPVNNGVIYDYLRLELDEAAVAMEPHAPTPGTSR